MKRSERSWMRSETGWRRRSERARAELAQAAARFDAIENDRASRMAAEAEAAENTAKLRRQLDDRAKQLQQFKRELIERRDHWQAEQASREAAPARTGRGTCAAGRGAWASRRIACRTGRANREPQTTSRVARTTKRRDEDACRGRIGGFHCPTAGIRRPFARLASCATTATAGIIRSGKRARRPATGARGGPGRVAVCPAA